MATLVTVVHIMTAFILIGLVLLQDSKGGGMGGAFGGGGSQSLLGATGAATLAQKATRWAAVVFAITSIGLSISSQNSSAKSVFEKAAVTESLPSPSSTLVPTSAIPESGATSASSTSTTKP